MEIAILITCILILVVAVYAVWILRYLNDHFLQEMFSHKKVSVEIQKDLRRAIQIKIPSFPRDPEPVVVNIVESKMPVEPVESEQQKEIRENREHLANRAAELQMRQASTGRNNLL